MSDGNCMMKKKHPNMLLLSGGATSLFHFSFLLLFYFTCLFFIFSFSEVLGSKPLTWLLFLFIFFLVYASQLFVDDHAWPLNLSYCLVHSCHVNTSTYDTFYKVFFSFNVKLITGAKKKKKDIKLFFLRSKYKANFTLFVFAF